MMFSGAKRSLAGLSGLLTRLLPTRTDAALAAACEPRGVMRSRKSLCVFFGVAVYLGAELIRQEILDLAEHALPEISASFA